MKTRFKWEPAALMVVIIALGFWLVWSPLPHGAVPPNARLAKISVGSEKGYVAVWDDTTGQRLRLLWRDGALTKELTEDEFIATFGQHVYDAVSDNAGNKVFRLLNVTTWASVLWVVTGFVGQVAFSGRMLVQWLVSEKMGKSYVPPSFWYMSLVGSVMLFSYFVWRQDVIGVLGQTSGVVIYARNLWLIYNQDDPSDRAEGEASDEKPVRKRASRPSRPKGRTRI